MIMNWINSGFIKNLKHNEMLNPLVQAWQNGSASAAYTPGHATVFAVTYRYLTIQIPLEKWFFVYYVTSREMFSTRFVQ